MLVQPILNCPEVYILRKFRHRLRRLLSVVAMAVKEEVVAMGYDRDLVERVGRDPGSYAPAVQPAPATHSILTVILY